ncbi:MAG: NADH-quinone oxidoreductase subunit N [Acidimicrobiales bacterium]|nr:NADH-quinone oxidoreductase subunit N [Acidimicrobiales bacterium]
MLAQVATPEVPWSLLWPFLLMALGAVALVTITSLVTELRTRQFPSLFTIAMAVGGGASLPYIWGRIGEIPERRILVLDGAMSIDYFTIVAAAIILSAVVFAAIFLDDYLRREGLDGPEWYVLIMLSASGGLMMAAAEDLIVTFLGLEILSIAVYVLAALHLRRAESQEAGFKYFVLGALSSAFFLYGIALVYGATGSTRLSEIDAALFATNARGLVPAEDSSMILAGMALLLVGFGFKVSAAPFHLWTPDVYQGAPTPVVGFMASAVKVGGFAGLLRVFLAGFGRLGDDWRPVVGAMALLSIVIGSFLAIRQDNVKRMLAYSSISHAGFILIGLFAAGSRNAEVAQLGTRSVLFYLFAYTVMVVGSFGVVTLVGGRGDGKHDLSDYAGLAQRSPILAGFFLVLLFAQAGIPFTSGFLAKFGVIQAAVRDEAYVLAGVAMVAAVVGAYLYLRIIKTMFFSDGAHTVPVAAALDTNVEATPDGAVIAPDEQISLPPAAVAAILVAVAITLLWGFAPNIGGDILRDAAATFLR